VGLKVVKGWPVVEAEYWHLQATSRCAFGHFTRSDMLKNRNYMGQMSGFVKLAGGSAPPQYANRAVA
jgi:hypothetical protein